MKTIAKHPYHAIGTILIAFYRIIKRASIRQYTPFLVKDVII